MDPIQPSARAALVDTVRRRDLLAIRILEWEALTTEVRDLLRELRPIEADILRQRFGLGTEQELTLGKNPKFRTQSGAIRIQDKL